MATRWSNMEEVQADLARATGQRIPLVDEGCLVYGERPPPMLTADEETEEEHQLRCAASMVMSQQSPDLRGITNMLRMIQSYGNCDAPNATTPTDQVVVISKPAPLSRRPDRVINQSASASISTLNPNVEAFVPSSMLSFVANGEIELEGADAITEQRRERAELEIMLRSRIRPEPDCDPSRRRERDKAIAGLLRLHCTSTGAAPALRTPDYFRTHRAEPVPAEPIPAEPVSAELVPAAEASEEEDEMASQELQVRASIGKVSAWLQQGERGSPAPPPASPAPPVPHLGPITYRRRTRAAAPPAARPAAGGGEAPRAAGDVRYVPSASARELSAQYAARAAAAPTPPPSLWARLERDLRRRDELASDSSLRCGSTQRTSS